MERFEEVYEIVKLIPKGRVTSFGAIAKYLGTSPRLVGWAMNANFGDQKIPAHRVVNRNGVLTGKMHFETPVTMEERLRVEGIKIENDQIINFKDYFWEPTTELL